MAPFSSPWGKTLTVPSCAGYSNRLAIGRDQDAGRGGGEREGLRWEVHGNVPDPREVVGPARRDLVALRIERDREHLPLVPLLAAVGADFLGRREIEELDRPVEARGGDERTVRTDGHGLDGVGMTLECGHDFRRGRLSMEATRQPNNRECQNGGSGETGKWHGEFSV